MVAGEAPASTSSGGVTRSTTTETNQSERVRAEGKGKREEVREDVVLTLELCGVVGADGDDYDGRILPGKSAASGGTRRRRSARLLDTEPPRKLRAAGEGEGDAGKKVARPGSSGVARSGGVASMSLS